MPLSPREIQLCHRIAADAFAASKTPFEFDAHVIEDSRFLDLAIDSQNAILARAKRLREHWLATGVKEPIKQNFLDELPEDSQPQQVQSMSANETTIGQLDGFFVPYEFKARLPIDHVRQIVSNLKSGNYERGENMELAGAAVGELGALTRSFGGQPVAMAAPPATIEECIELFKSIDGDVQTMALPPWAIPVIEFIIREILKRIGQPSD